MISKSNPLQNSHVRTDIVRLYYDNMINQELDYCILIMQCQLINIKCSLWLCYRILMILWTLCMNYLERKCNDYITIQEENMELRRRKDHGCEKYAWMDYMTLTFTQNVGS